MVLSREVALTLEGKDVKRRFSLISDRMIDCYPALLEDVIPKKRVHEKGNEKSAKLIKFLNLNQRLQTGECMEMEHTHMYPNLDKFLVLELGADGEQ
ncbi:hypothetical protein CEXT_678441 [Caerostris extrusa]|uniref:Uncharacterized protein n=1 Tax=Caerostris extrusa TaxID=172846 RepID=A0AAV4U9J7_CAEEX|nr:hypothetical protein CEXT_678441 [Caerostris extrusa]